MEKVIRKFSDGWGDYDCSSNRNMPKTFRWTPSGTAENYDHTIYVDNYILNYGNGDSSKEKLGWLLETPQLNENVIQHILSNLEYYKENYKYIFTCIDDLVAIGHPFTYTISNAVPWIYPSNRKIHKKTKLVSMIASDKGWLNGHKERLVWVERLKDKVDLFGTGRPNALKDKEDGIRDYMFSVSIENDLTNSYFTEKLTDNFAMGTVPIYLGSRKVVERYFNPKGVIFLEDDPTLTTATPETYEAMKPYIEENYGLVMEIPLAEDYIYETYLKK